MSRWRSARAMSSALCPALFTLVLCAAFAVSCGAKHDLSGTLIVPLILDDYAVAAEPYPFWLDAVQRLSDGAFLLRLTGESERQYAIDATTDFMDWYALKTNSVGTDGTFDFVDTTAANYSRSFYRARLVQ